MTDIVSGDGKSEYDLYAHEDLPRKVDHDLEMWGCVACNFCVTVCPNDAFFRLPTPEGAEISGASSTSCSPSCATSAATAWSSAPKPATRPRSNPSST